MSFLCLYSDQVDEAEMTNRVEIPEMQKFGALSYLKSFLLDELYIFHVDSFHLKCVLYIVPASEAGRGWEGTKAMDLIKCVRQPKQEVKYGPDNHLG